MDHLSANNMHELGDKNTSDITVRLINKEGRLQLFYLHSSILKAKSKFFAERLSAQNPSSFVDIFCSSSDYDYHIELLRRLYLRDDSLLDSWASVESALGVLQVSTSLRCKEITSSCIQYLEAVPWEDKEEELILKAASKLGPEAMPILARIRPVDLTATKNVLIAAIRFATSIDGPCPPFGDELKTSAQEQIEFMLGDDEDIPLVAVDKEIISEITAGLSNLCSLFENELSSLVLENNLPFEAAEKRVTQSLSDLEWMCNILPKMDLMKEFVSSWLGISKKILDVLDDSKLYFKMWGLKLKIVEVTGKVLEAVGYGNVIFPPPFRLGLLRMWLPFIRKMKPLLDSTGREETGFSYRMDEELWQSIEGAVVAMISALPSNDQAEMLADWMNGEQGKYPDLSEAFEVWCYRTKSAKRRLVESFDSVGKATVSL